MPQITTAIGSTFGAEVLASSLAGLPFSWGEDGVHWADGALTDTQVAALQALVGAHDHTRLPPRLATGKQLCEALADLGQLAAWDAAIQATHKPEDRLYWQSSYREAIPEGNAKISRIATACGVSVAALYDKALTEPAV